MCEILVPILDIKFWW